MRYRTLLIGVACGAVLWCIIIGAGRFLVWLAGGA